MNTQHISSSQASYSLRARSADFFKMDVPHAMTVVPMCDSNPLRRTLNKFDSMDSWETNENMCVALWELMTRS